MIGCASADETRPFVMKSPLARFSALDGFQVVSGLLAVVAGPFMLAAGFPAGWAFLAIVAGIVVLLAQWAIAAEITVDRPDTVTIALGIIGIACIGIAIVYLTRAADDLPTIFPGYDADTENFKLVPGITTFTVGAVVLARVLAHVHLARAHHQRDTIVPESKRST
jgi:hypothetical protein